MIAGKRKLPIGIDNFEKMIKDQFYYADKTGLISELLCNWGQVNLFTRPRRFGKSLNMSMLEQFFSIEGEKGLFDGLQISNDTELCREYMGKYSVISISLKGINAASYETAFRLTVQTIKDAASKVYFLLDSDKLNANDKTQYRELLDKNMDEATLSGSLKKMSELLEKHYGTKVILLIDEYDVPLAKAFENGYYDQMVFLIRNLLEQALKTNDSLQFAVMTGCMRISKESIFTGLNNLKVLSITDDRFDEYFGFTDADVKKMLRYYEREEHYEEIRNWYNGYRFGSTDVYCPWDVLNHCDKIKENRAAFPENYWIHTSGNEAVKKIIQMSGNITVKREIESLLAGEEIVKMIRQELTYPEMYQSAENIWSLLFMTGYLTQRERLDACRYKLAIPNLEIRDIFKTQIMEYFKEGVAKDGDTLNRLCDALKRGDSEEVERIFGGYLKKTISIRDSFVKKTLKENFYHGILIGILGIKEEWGVFSNKETGDGYSDIMVETEDSEIGMIIELKYAGDGNLEKACKKALKQIEETKYEETLLENGAVKILKYGIACYMKHCKVMCLGGVHGDS